MDFLFSLLFEYLLWLPWLSEEPKIEVRLLSCFPNSENKLNIEIENISNILITLKSISIVLKNRDSYDLSLYDLGLGNEDFILSSFSPHKAVLTVSDKEIIEKIMYFKFELKESKRSKLTAFPINSFKNS